MKLFAYLRSLKDLTRKQERIRAKKSRQKTGYQVTNWSAYNKSLVNRGDITFWFSEEVLTNWKHANKGFKVGRPFVYSDAAIEVLLTLGELFQLPYRQTEGFGCALVKLMGAEVAIHNYTSLAKRAARMQVSIVIEKVTGSIDIVVDRTGLKVHREGQWKVRQHDVGGRRTWRKVHRPVGPDTHQIVAEVLNGNDAHDSAPALDLVKQSGRAIDTFYGDGAYDSWDIHDRLQKQQIDALIPHRRGSVIKQHANCNADPMPREQSVRQIRRDGRKARKEQVGYHRRSNAETAMSRLKGGFGDRLKNRKMENQKTETDIRCKILNMFVMLGMPLSLGS